MASIDDRITEVRRRSGTERAILFLHGFGGDHRSTWSCFPFIVGTEPSLTGWDILSLGYSTTLLPDIRGIWSADPDLPKLALHLKTRVGIAPLQQYRSIAIVAHSMGGLVAQKALLDDPGLGSRVSHLLMFGTPSNGLHKAGFFAFLKPQLKNMADDGAFIRDLRAGWAKSYGEPRFKLLVTAGDRDQFVPIESSLHPFPDDVRRVVAGDHLSMVKPEDGAAESVCLLVGALTAQAMPPAAAAPLRTSALEMTAPEVEQALADRKKTLTEAEIVNAALTMDLTGRRQQAIDLLERHLDQGTDVQGTLGGRFKRRWLETGDEQHARRAFDLYRQALDSSLDAGDHEQAYYHAINLAFLSYVVWDRRDEARRLARLALRHCAKSRESTWRLATEAEARLYLDQPGPAFDRYRQLFATGAERWQLQSTGLQAYQIAHRRGDVELEEKLRALFNPESFQAT